MLIKLALITLFATTTAFAQVPAIEPGVSHDLAKWRAARYSDVRYKLNLTLEKMSPVLKGTIEIRVGVRTLLSASAQGAETPPIILDWRKIRGSESLSTISNVSLNGVAVSPPSGDADKSVRTPFEENEHLIFREGVKFGENVIKLDFTSPILTSGSAITRYVDKEDGAEYIYSLFVPSDASTAFPVFDQPDLKARFTLTVFKPAGWKVIANTSPSSEEECGFLLEPMPECMTGMSFWETKPISTYVFAFAAGSFEAFEDKGGNPTGREGVLVPDKDSTFATPKNTLPTGRVSASDATISSHIYVRKSQAAKFKPHAAEVFRLNREGIKYLESYFDYKFPFPKYDLVLIPEFPFGGMEHAGATFLRESSVIFPQEPTKNDYISRANVIFHEAAHQWFGDTVTMKWFDDLWLKEGFAEFMAYKTLEKVMPEVNAWKVFYERNKQAAYLTDSTKGTTPIYQEIANLNSAKSAYGNIVYRKAPSFLRQAEFLFGEEQFQKAIRAFLKKHEFANAEFGGLIKEFEMVSGYQLQDWGNAWVKQRGAPIIKIGDKSITQTDPLGQGSRWVQQVKIYSFEKNPNPLYKDMSKTEPILLRELNQPINLSEKATFIFPNYQDYGYGIFLLDDKSRNYVLKNIQNEKDDFLRTMMWGSLWDSVREGELDPKDYVELVIKNLDPNAQARTSVRANRELASPESDESTIQTLLSRVSIAMTYYMPLSVSSPHVSKGSTEFKDTVEPSNTAANPTSRITAQRPSNTTSTPPAYAGGSDLKARLEAVLIDRMQNAPTLGQRITFYRAFLGAASSDNARNVFKTMLAKGTTGGNASVNERANLSSPATARSLTVAFPPLRTKDKFDIVTRLIILDDPEAPKLLADLEKTETSDEAKRYAYAAKAGFATAENKAKFWSEFTTSKEISESWVEASLGAFNSTKHAALTLPYLEKALAELPNLKRSRKIFFVNNWLAAFIAGQRSEQALAIINKFLADNPNLDKDLRLKILENSDLIERAVKIRGKFKNI